MAAPQQVVALEREGPSSAQQVELALEQLLQTSGNSPWPQGAAVPVGWQSRRGRLAGASPAVGRATDQESFPSGDLQHNRRRDGRRIGPEPRPRPAARGLCGFQRET